MKHFFFLLILSLLCSNVIFGQLDEKEIKAVDDLFSEWNEASPGYAIGVVKDGELVYTQGYGQATLEYDVPIKPNTIFHMASVSKQFTAFAIALLAEQGKLSLDDEIQKYIPELPDFGEKITIRHLVHHTSGLRDQWNLLAMAGWRLDDVITRDQILQLFTKQKELNTTPGAEYNYCNTGYTLQGEIVARVTGMPFSAWMKENVFDPLGMENTIFYDDHERIVPNRAYSYQKTDKGYKKSVLSYANAGATSLFTTVEDMAKWNNNFYEPQVGKRETIALTHERGILNSGDTIPYAFGQVIDTYKGMNRIAHGGADAGYRTYFVRFPEHQGAVIVLSNMANANPTGLALEIADIVWADKIEQLKEVVEEKAELKPIELSSEILKRYEGTYTIEQFGVQLKIELKRDTLFTEQLWNGISFALIPVSETKFFNQEGPDLVLNFERPKPEDKWGIAIEQGNSKFKAVQKEKFIPLPAELAAYSGTYYSDELETFYHIKVKEDRLEVSHLRHPPFEISFTEKDKAAGNAWFFSQIEFTRDDEEAIKEMLVSSGRVRNVRFSKMD